MPRGAYKIPSFLPLNSSGKSYLFTPKNDAGSVSSFYIRPERINVRDPAMVIKEGKTYFFATE